MDEAFKIPTLIPQDLQLIHDIVGPDLSATKPPVPSSDTKGKEADHNIDSSDNDTDSEGEVEADILIGIDEDGGSRAYAHH